MTAAHIGVVLHDFSTGGSERIAIRLSNAWAEAGRRVTLYCGSEDGALRALVSPNVAVCMCDPEIKRSPISRIMLSVRMQRLIQQQAPDILFSPGNSHIMTFALLGRLRGALRPVMVCKLSNPVRHSEAPNWIERVWERVIRRAAAPISAFIAMSPALRRQAMTLFTHHPVHHIDEPVLDDAPLITSEPRAKADVPRIICVGRLAPQKDFGLALAAFAAVKADSGARLVLLGEGEECDSLMAAAVRLGIADRVDFKGYVTDVATYLSQSSLYLMTSRFEGYPAVLIEAMAAGLPIVTTDCSPAIHEIVCAPELGIVVNSRDPDQLARAIAAVRRAPRPSTEMSGQATARNRMGASSVAYLAIFDQLVANAARDA